MILKKYVNQNTEPTKDILKWWRDRAKGFSKLVPIVQDILAMHASSVASKASLVKQGFNLENIGIH